ncbi:sensor histidine kinase [Bacillus infantis]|nr:sensor histidine kinase [Bacillus infantis]
MEITRHLFFNLALIIILLFFSLVWSERRQKISFSRVSSFIWLSLMLWLSLQFSFKSSSDFQFDLRLIPVLIGGLYAGLGPWLSVIAIVFRSFFGIGTGFWLNVLLYVPLAFLLWRIYPKFKIQPPQKRIAFSVLLTVILSVVTVIAMEIWSSPESRLDAWAAHLAVPTVGVAMISYIIEYVRKDLELKKKLIKTEKLEAVEQMGAAISHEIRNPLTAAAGFVQLLIEHPQPLEKRREYLNIVKGELESAERVIKDYLTFTKPSLDYIEEINVKKEITQVINILTPLANQNSVRITANFALLGSIEGDRQKFHQSLLNVLKNAIEAMPKGGDLLVETNYTKSHISISVKDTGVGMTPEQLQKLGEPYYSTKGSKGTGLGMMVVFSIVKAMKGTIKVESKVGAGTTFYFSFPVFSPSAKNERF